MSEGKTGISAVIESAGVGEPPKVEAEQLALLPLSAPGTDPRAENLVEMKREGAGRPAGSRNKRTSEWAEYLLSRYQSPLVVLAETYSRPTEDLAKELGCKVEDAFKMQLAAAKELAPYVHQRQPQALQLDTSGEVTMTLGVSQAFLDMVAKNDDRMNEGTDLNISGEFIDVEMEGDENVE